MDEILEGGYFSFATSAGTDFAFSREHLLGLPSPKERLQALGYTLFRDKGVVLSPIVQVEEWKQEAPDDIRFRSMNNTLQNLLPKYDSLSIAVFSGAPQQIPYIKLGEIYLIGAESALKLNDISGAYSYLSSFVDKRFSKTSIVETSTATELMEEIEKQYVREFLGEGQLFYCYKRWNLSSIPSYNGRSIEMTKAKYVWPIPVN